MANLVIGQLLGNSKSLGIPFMNYMSSRRILRLPSSLTLLDLVLLKVGQVLHFDTGQLEGFINGHFVLVEYTAFFG